MTERFDHVAPVYDALAYLVFGNKLKQAPLYFIDRLPVIQDILVVGGGTGSILQDLRARYSAAQITFLEPSKAMMNKAQKRGVPHIRFEPLKIQDFHSDDTYDLIFTPFVLDVFSEVELMNVMNCIYQLLQPGGHWIHSDFYQGQNLWWQASLINGMYRFFRVSAGLDQQHLLNFDHYFQKFTGLTYQQERSWSKGLIKTVWWLKQKEQPL